MHNLTDSQNKALLTELATYQNRKLLLWQLAADGRSFCGVRFVAREHDLQNAPVDEQVHAFVDDISRREYSNSIHEVCSKQLVNTDDLLSSKSPWSTTRLPAFRVTSVRVHSQHPSNNNPSPIVAVSQN
jgi:hypothetical protein